MGMNKPLNLTEMEVVICMERILLTPRCYTRECLIAGISCVIKSATMENRCNFLNKIYAVMLYIYKE